MERQRIIEGSRVRTGRWPGTYGTVTRVDDGRIYVVWHGTDHEVEAHPSDLTLAWQSGAVGRGELTC